MRISENLEVVSQMGDKVVKCYRCDHVYGPAHENVKQHAKMKAFPITKAGPMLNPWREVEYFELREFYCPSCATLISVELNRKDAPLIWDIQIA